MKFSNASIVVMLVVMIFLLDGCATISEKQARIRFQRELANSTRLVSAEKALIEGNIALGVGLLGQLLKDPDLLKRRADECMTTDPLHVTEDRLAVEALKEMEDHRITSLVVVRDQRLVGLLHLHDLWRTEMF